MDGKIQAQKQGSYTANLLGNIRSHLAGLQGYDVMALELIQNADDAKAEKIVFEITNQGLLVRNSGQFTYCGDLAARPCPSIASSNYGCDYHRIADVGSGGKLSRGENIGRFGIGFVSTYQVTDHPEIRSAGIKLTLHPEAGQWFIEPFAEPHGTTFFLPWAEDPNTEARLALGISHISATHIDQIAEDFQRVLRNSLLFLRHVRNAEVWRNGELMLACDLDRGSASDLIVGFRPDGDPEHWHILRADAEDAAADLCASHPRLEALRRSTKVSIGLRIDPKSLADGLLYAFLPTEQGTGLPIHINADFFPESDRKAVIFAGHQHEQAWNEMLIDAAATELARDPERLWAMTGDVGLWQILARAYELSRQPNHPSCFKRFWERLKVTAPQARIALAEDGSVQRPSGVFLPRSPLSPAQTKALLEVGGRLAAENLRPYQTVMNQLGAPFLTLERLVSLLETTTAQQAGGQTEVTEERIDNYYRPIWSMVNDLLPETSSQNPAANPIVQRLKAIPFVVTEDSFVVTINQSYLAPVSIDAERVAGLLPRLAIASHHLLDFPKLARLIQHLQLDGVVSHIKAMCADEPIEEVIGVEKQELRELYSLFSELDRRGDADNSVYEILRSLPIWLSSRGLIKATEALLPGDFNDPTAQSDLLETAVLTDSARDFVTRRLGVQTQTIQAFVRTVLPKFFDEDGPREKQKYSRLISELANHPALVNDESICRLLGSLPIAPTQDGQWSRPTNIYRRTDDLIRVLGDSSRLCLDTSRIPNDRSVHNFIDSLGILRTPLARHLVDRMLFVAGTYLPTEDSRRAVGEAFYVLCEQYEERKDKGTLKSAIDDLRGAKCFPAIGDGEVWYAASSLYAPYRPEAFESQASILDFRSLGRLSRDLLKALEVSLEPETQLVINHLRHCVKHEVSAPFTTYQILNERTKEDSALISTLSGEPFIYIESQKSFVRSNQLFWLPQQLGRHAFTIPGNLELFKPLFTAVGVKDVPEGKEFVDIILDIVGDCFERSVAVTGSDRAVYDSCLAGISTAHEQEQLASTDLVRLQEAPTIVNLLGHPTHPDEVFLQDSEWHAGFFGGELNRALCKFAPELWALVEEVGVRRLSESAEVALEFVDGQKTDETALAEMLTRRVDILTRLLHDKSTAVTGKIRTELSELAAVSYELVRIQASVQIAGDNVAAPPSPAHAFYDIEKRQLILSRPVGDRSWPHILSAVFHQLMPEESGSEISKLTLSVRPLMAMSVEDAHRELTDAGIPFLNDGTKSGVTEDLTSPDLDEIGVVINDVDPQGESGCSPDEAIEKGDKSGRAQGDDKPTEESKPGTDGRPSDQGHGEGETQNPTEETAGEGDGSVDGGGGKGTSGGKRGTKKPRPKHKEQWDRRLLSYVRKNSQIPTDSEGNGGDSEHNLAVEAVARAAVCTYEKSRGRIATQMAQTHPGYDIISVNPLSGEERFIEVKGVNGEWNQTGVGLSRLQFSNAQDYGDSYWLYVVEFVSDSQHLRIHPIQSPAIQVTSFMFDGNWRDAAAQERADPSLAFIVGARVRHQQWGLGRIISMDLRGSTRVMSIEFDTAGRRTVTLNLQTMSVVDDDDDPDHS